MNSTTQRWCIWCGPVFAVLFGIGFALIAGFLPPPSPNDNAAQVARMYTEDRDRIRAGILLAVFGSLLYLPFISMLSAHMKKIEGEISPLASVQMAAGILTAVVFIFPPMVIEAAAFRTDRSPETLQTLNDVAWIPFFGLVGPPMAQCVALAVAILQDRHPEPLYPRWAGYLNGWMAVLFAPGLFLVFFKTGPLAWNGLFAFYLPAGFFFIWLLIMTKLALQATAHNTRLRPTAQKQSQATPM